jgi:hypothetical protein
MTASCGRIGALVMRMQGRYLETPGLALTLRAAPSAASALTRPRALRESGPRQVVPADSPFTRPEAQRARGQRSTDNVQPVFDTQETR